jgi:Fe-S-cluster containining protein
MEFNFTTGATLFSCTRCSRCCSLDVALSEEEMEKLGEDDVDRRWRTTRKVMGPSDPVCCLLKGNACTIYKSRPKLCRVYPFFAVPVAELDAIKVPIPESAIRVLDQGESYVIIYDERCPGIGKGCACNWPEVVSIIKSHTREFEKT